MREASELDNLGDFLKIQEITFPMSTKTSTFCQKMAEKTEVKVVYPPQNGKNIRIFAFSNKGILSF